MTNQRFTRLGVPYPSGGFQMESNGAGHQHEHQAPRGFTPSSALSSGAGANIEGRREDLFPASEIMPLALEITRTSADIYEMVAEIARYSSVPPEVDGTTGCSPLQRHQARLRGITEAIESTELQAQLLESKTGAPRSEIFDLFLEDCRAALATFKEVSERLAGIIGPESSGDPSSTAAEILSQIMKRLENCSKRVIELPETGLAASYQCLAGTAFELQRRAGKLIGGAVRRP